MFKDFYLNIMLEKDGYMPTRAHDTDAGLDVYAPMDVVIDSRSDWLIPLNWRCEFPSGYVLMVKEKSGRAVKDKLFTGACCIDSSYRGIVHVHLFNYSDISVIINRGEKIAQMLVYPCWSGEPIQVDKLSDTERGEGGFGSTTLTKRR